MGARWEYKLGDRNLEVSAALNDRVAKALIGQPGQASELSSRLYDILVASGVEGQRGHITSLFAEISHQWHDGHPIARYEGFSASVF
jgi:hypothetical protein